MRNQITEEKKSFSMTTTIFQKVVDHVFDRVERILVILNHEVFSEIEAAIYLRLPDPEGSGRQSIRYYALNAKQLPYIKIGRDGLLFQRSALNS